MEDGRAAQLNDLVHKEPTLTREMVTAEEKIKVELLCSSADKRIANGMSSHLQKLGTSSISSPINP